MKNKIELEKEKAESIVEEYKKLIEDDITELKANSTKIVNHTLLGGGILLGGYLVSRLFISKDNSKSKKKVKTLKKVSETSEILEPKVKEKQKANTGNFLNNPITQSILSQATIMLLNVAREKLEELISKDEESN